MAEHYLPAEEQGAERNLPFLTKNALSNSVSTFDADRLKGKFTFNKAERLTNVTALDKLFQEGKTVNIGSFALLYLSHTLQTPFPAQVTFAVSKRNFRHAHHRNTIKRLLRECWRVQKLRLYEVLHQQQLQLAVCVMYKGKVLPDFATTDAAVNKLIDKLLERVIKLKQT